MKHFLTNACASKRYRFTHRASSRQSWIDGNLFNILRRNGQTPEHNQKACSKALLAEIASRSDQQKTTKNTGEYDSPFHLLDHQ